jgi:hypothetical protein
MRYPVRSSILVLFLLLGGAAGAATARQDPAPTQPPARVDLSQLYTNHYQVRFLDVHAAEALVWEQCPQDRNHCRVQGQAVANGAALEVTADSATHERIARALAKRGAVPQTRTFQLVLLVADDQPESGGAALPPGAQKALQDVRGFLPFKSYHLLDSTWLRTTEQAEARLLSPTGTSYLARLRFEETGGEGADRQLFVNLFKLYQESERPAAAPAPPAPAPAAAPAAVPAPPAPADPTRTLVSTSFGLKVGETIVVGTSRMEGGGKALVVLLTAIS